MLTQLLKTEYQRGRTCTAHSTKRTLINYLTS